MTTFTQLKIITFFDPALNQAESKHHIMNSLQINYGSTLSPNDSPAMTLTVTPSLVVLGISLSRSS